MRAIVKLDPLIAAAPIQLRLRLIVGRNSHGLWVVREQLGRCGGVFRTREEAIRFALEQASFRPGAVLISADPIELFPANPGGEVTSRLVTRPARVPGD